MLDRPLLATCPRGLAPVLAREIRELGLDVLEEQAFGVAVRGDLELAMRLNLCLRTAHRVHLHLASFKASGPDQLYREVERLPWEKLITPDGYVSVHSHIQTEAVKDSRFANVRLKDGLADRMRRVTGRRPDSGPDKGRAVIFLHWSGQDCQVWLDTSGEPLNRRGWRTMPHKAPLQETLAAGLILSSRFQPGMDFFNPMCGSGSLGIEAALLAMARSPGLSRDNFGFMHVIPFSPKRLAAIQQELEKQCLEKPGGRFILSDHDPDAIKAARHNARKAGVDRWCEFAACDFAETPVAGRGGVVMLNPEYGMRMGDEERLAETYGRIGDFFKQRCQGMTGYVFTGNPKLAKTVGLRAKRRIPFFNSQIECRLLEYELYAGSRKPS